MCGINPNQLCRWSDALPGQFGFTKQLVFRVALPHITLLLLAVAYAIIGSAVLTAFDYDGFTTKRDREEMDTFENRLTEAKKFIIKEIVEEITRISNNSSPGKMELEDNILMKRALQRFQSRLYALHVEGNNPLNSSAESIRHGFIWNLFFTVTWLTSIGYGENAPSNFAKRLFCIVYLIFGIPLYLVTLADLAKFGTEGINRTYTEVLKCKHQLASWYRHRTQVHCSQRQPDPLLLTTKDHYAGEPSLEIQPPKERRRKRREMGSRRERCILGSTEEEMAEFLWKHLEKTQFVEVPFVLIYVLLVAYILCASYIVSRLENWSQFDGLYFIIMSVLTIGFGDIVPSNTEFILPILIVILVGLIVATTFIDMVGAYYIDRLHFFGRRVDLEDPLEWLKAVQQKRIEAMKREAMRKLFETVTAMYRFQLMPPLPKLQSPKRGTKGAAEFTIPMPRGIVVFNVTADSVTLKWEPPVQVLLEAKKFWYTLSYKPRTPHHQNTVKCIDFIRQNRFVVTGLRSFTLYEFNVRISTREGASKPARCQEYTEPCTVPQLLQLDAISAETATISWKAPKKNNGPESYLLLFAQEPSPQFQFWRRYECGKRKRFTLTELNPDTRYIVCIFAMHNFGLAAISRSLRFKTRSWWYEEQSTDERDDLAIALAKARQFLAPPAFNHWMLGPARRPSLREPSIGAASDTTRRSSLQSGEYQDRS